MRVHPAFGVTIALAFSSGALFAAAGSARSQRPTASTVIALKQWVRAVNDHAPGTRDAALESIWSWTPEVRQAISTGMGLFLTSLDRGDTQPRVVDERTAIIDLGFTQRLTVGRNVFIERAVVLEADAVVLQRPSASTAPSREPPNALQSGRASALFPAGEVVLANDGDTLGMAPANWHWTFARSLIDHIDPQAPGASFLAQWYHATTVYLLAGRAWGEARGQLDHAAALLPNDARIRFDLGCVSEVLGLPESQQLLSNEDLAAMRFRRVPGQRVPPDFPRVSATTARTGIPPAEVANADAERFFRRALDVDPELVEARVRWARLLELRGQYKEATLQLETALESTSISGDPALAFYAHLFAARAQVAMGQLDAAATHLRTARQLFPQAQSAMTAASAVALQRGDVTGAMDLFDQLANRSPGLPEQSDPWWQYDQGPGRHAERLLRQMWVEAQGLGKH